MNVNSITTGAGQIQSPSILQRVMEREEQDIRHSASLDNHSARLRRIENALGLDPMPETDMPMAPRQQFNY